MWLCAARSDNPGMALTADEDQELRRIHVLAQFGDLPETMLARFRELRSRDRRQTIREPTVDIEVLPRQRTSEEDDDVVETVLTLGP